MIVVKTRSSNQETPSVALLIIVLSLPVSVPLFRWIPRHCWGEGTRTGRGSGAHSPLRLSPSCSTTHWIYLYLYFS